MMIDNQKKKKHDKIIIRDTHIYRCVALIHLLWHKSVQNF